MSKHDADTFKPDYLSPAPTPEAAALRAAKGSSRRTMIESVLQKGGPVGSAPPEWLRHDLDELHQSMLQPLTPRAPGGEDLPNLRIGEPETARISLVDEHEMVFRLPRAETSMPLTESEPLELLSATDPSQLHSGCHMRLDSAFYSGLDEVALRLKVKRFEGGY